MAEIFSKIAQQRDISYISRDFNSLRTNLSNYLKIQFPNTFSDFTDVSSGMAFLELVCYVGDILNFYLDKQFNEIFLQEAQEEKNIIALAKNLGYPTRGKAAAINDNIVLTFVYPATGISTSNFDFILYSGSRFSTQAGDVTFELSDNVDTSLTANKSTTANIAANSTTCSISGITVIAGVTKNFTTQIGNIIPFLKIPLPDNDILEVISISGSDGSIWYQVDYLAQENTFVGVMNTDSSSSTIPYIMTLKRVPKRFTLERDVNGQAAVRFGSGVITTTDSEFIPNPEDFILPVTLRGTVSGFSPAIVDPADFINTGTLGASPSNVTLNIKYRTGGGLNTNIVSNSITRISLKNLSYKVTGNTFLKSQLETTMTVSNPEPCGGGDDYENLQSIKENASAFFAAQNRVVTLQDYIVRIMTMPAKFGSVFRATASKDPQDRMGIKLSVIARNSDGTLTQAPNSLKINVANYLLQFKSYSENINIVDANIIDIGVQFGIVVDGRTNNQEILANCLQTLTNFFDISTWNIGQSISISMIMHELSSINGVLAVPIVNITNLVGVINNRQYSNTAYNIQGNMKNFVIQCDNNSIFQVHYTNWDIQGAILS